MGLLKYKEFVSILESNYHLYYTPIMEGGAYGHLNHPFDNIDLTFLDLQEMLNASIEGSFGVENFIMEKTDGQNIMISWRDGSLVAARNKSHLKNKGANALTIDGIAKMFAGRGEIETAFNNAMADLSSAISAFSEKDKQKYFANGSKFASIEVITPKTQNVIPYGLDMLVFHGITEYDENGEAIEEDKQAGRDIAKLMKVLNADTQKTFFIRGPHDVEIKPLPNFAARKSYYQKKLNSVMQESGCTLNSTVGDYVIGMATKIFKTAAQKDAITVPQEIESRLIRRIANIDETLTYTINQIKKDFGVDNTKWFVDYEKKNSKKIKREIYGPIENLFLELGTEIMKNVSSFLTANPTSAAIKMKKEIDDAISKIRTNGDQEDIEKLEHELKRISSAGGLESIVPSEGITFVFKGKLYKYTGLFAPINQLKGMLIY